MIKPPTTAVTTSVTNAAETAAQNYNAVTIQMEELLVSINARTSRIENYQDGIRSEREAIRNERLELSRLRRKRRVFDRARFDLNQIDQDIVP